MPIRQLSNASAGATLADYTSAGLIVPNLRGLDAPAVIQELSAALRREGCVNDALPLCQAALNREYLCSTLIEPGWALPHALVKSLKTLRFALGRTVAPISWVGNNWLRGRFVFLFAVPATDARDYMALTRAVANLGNDVRLVGRLLDAQCSGEMLTVLQTIKTTMALVPHEPS